MYNSTQSILDTQLKAKIKPASKLKWDQQTMKEQFLKTFVDMSGETINCLSLQMMVTLEVYLVSDNIMDLTLRWNILIFYHKNEKLASFPKNIICFDI